ncbi:hypothetical protein ACFVFF_07730 [Streptomyces sp. NPDC057680]|uniref:hypothetical protein n=1 Tax=Streptomyces sp. NPDC057680 TaxID=3346208 RepID=UPI0036B1F76D
MTPELVTGSTVLSGGGGYTPLPDGRVLTPDGYAEDVETLQRALASTPDNTRRSRDSRTAAYVSWCGDRGRLHTDPGSLADYAAALAGRRHPAETIAVYTSTIAERLPAVGRTILESEHALIRAIVSQRAQEEARDDGGQGDVLQATECTREDLSAMLATLDRTAVEAIRDALVLSLDWYMAGRASEPASLNLRDVVEESIRLVDSDTGELVELATLVITLRLSKTNPYGNTADVIRIAAQDDDTCPVAAYRAWTAFLVSAGVTSGPLLRRVKAGILTTAGRPPKDPTRAGSATGLSATSSRPPRSRRASPGRWTLRSGLSCRPLRNRENSTPWSSPTPGGRPSRSAGGSRGALCGERGRGTRGIPCAGARCETTNGAGPPTRHRATEPVRARLQSTRAVPRRHRAGGQNLTFPGRFRTAQGELRRAGRSRRGRFAAGGEGNSLTRWRRACRHSAPGSELTGGSIMLLDRSLKALCALHTPISPGQQPPSTGPPLAHDRVRMFLTPRTEDLSKNFADWAVPRGR